MLSRHKMANLLVILLIVGLLAACGGSAAPEANVDQPASEVTVEEEAAQAPAEAEEPVEEEEAAPTDNEDIKIGMSVLNLANPFFVALADGAQEEADALGVELVITDPKDDVNAQVTQLENFINGGFDGFVVTAVDPAAIAPLAKDALDNGMHVVAHTSDLGEENQSALVWAVEHDMGYTLGLQAGEWAVEHIPEGETLKLGILNYDVIPQVIQRREGIVDGIEEVFGDNYEIIGNVTAGDPTTGLEAAETWLQANPDMHMITGINDGGALGAYQAVIAADMNDPDTFFVGGIDATDEALAAIKDGGAYQATVDQQPKEMGALTVRTLVAAIAGQPYETISAIELAPVNVTNVDDFIE
jgi:ribose transport system substrate-binding protein